MSDEPSNPDWLLERISNLNGQVVASHMMNAILFYTLRTGAPVESIYRNIQSFSEFFVEDLKPLFPSHRDAFIHGFRAAITPGPVAASAIGEVMEKLGHLDPPWASPPTPRPPGRFALPSQIVVAGVGMPQGVREGIAVGGFAPKVGFPTDF